MKSLRHALPCLLAAALFAQGCATPYSGPKPNLSARGDAAQAEYSRFRMNDASLGQRAGAYRVGLEGELYTRKSFDPIIADVSPRAADQIKTADHWRAAQLVSLIVALGGAVAAISMGEHTTLTDWLFWGGAGASLSCGVVHSTQVAKAASYYNEDLRSKLGLSPQLSRLPLPKPQLQFSFAF